ncbi:hypothetical protein Hanom_Chr06g00482011 [Helianthus anomalus]
MQEKSRLQESVIQHLKVKSKSYSLQNGQARLSWVMGQSGFG